jgi:glycosyltransferase involved in cell wall biosynthesis
LGRSGIGTTAWHQVSGLIEAGQEVTVACGTCERPVEGAHVIETMRVASVRIPYRAIGVERAWKLHDWQVARLLRSRRDRIDVVHTWPSGALITLQAAKELGIRSFLERPNTHTGYAYEIVRQECERLGLSQPKGACHTNNPKRLAREESEFHAADRLLCPSEFVAKTFVERGYPAQQISRHRYGCDPTRFRPLDVNTEGPPPNGAFTVAFVGTCEPRKGLHLALRAWLKSPASATGVFYVCGRFVPGYRELLAPMLAHASVKEMGFMSDVSQVMARSHVMVLPTLEEGSALVTYEARASGCVLMVSEAAGALAEHMANALVHRVGDVETLSQQFTQLAEDRGLLARLREQSVKEIETLSWSCAARDLVNRYQESLNGGRGVGIR